MTPVAPSLGLGPVLVLTMVAGAVPTLLLWTWHAVFAGERLVSLVSALMVVWTVLALAIWVSAGVRWAPLWAILLGLVSWPVQLVVCVLYAVAAAQIALSMAPTLPGGSGLDWLQWVVVGPGLPLSAFNVAVTVGVAAVAVFGPRRLASR